MRISSQTTHPNPYSVRISNPLEIIGRLEQYGILATAH